MGEVEFQIKIDSPIALTLDLAKDLVVRLKPRWRVRTIDLRRIDANSFECKVGIAREDISLDDKAGLIEFRDHFLSLLAFTVMAPVRLLTKGLGTFPLGGGKFAQVSLGAAEKTFAPTTLPSIASLIEGLALPKVYVATLRFVWQALNSDEPLYRFINLAIAHELVIGADSHAQASKHPVCRSCGHEISECPICRKELKIPSTLRERGAFLFPDKELLARFIEFRNRVFHGGLTSLDTESANELERLNNQLLVNIRNYLGPSLGLNSIREEDLPMALNAPQIYMTVYYSVQSDQEGMAGTR
jgi:hypothetical protein